MYIMFSGSVGLGGGGYATINGSDITSDNTDHIDEGRNVYLYYNVPKGSVIKFGVNNEAWHMHLHAKEK